MTNFKAWVDEMMKDPKFAAGYTQSKYDIDMIDVIFSCLAKHAGKEAAQWFFARMKAMHELENILEEQDEKLAFQEERIEKHEKRLQSLEKYYEKESNYER